MMRKNNYLNEKTDIPETVLNKEDEVFTFIRKSCGINEAAGHVSENVSSESSREQTASYRKPLTFKKLLKMPVFAAVLILLISLSCGAAIAAVVSDSWSRGLHASIETTDDLRVSLMERGFVKNLDMEPITINGVTVTPVTAITDGTVGFISLKISGYTPAKGGSPMFASKGEFYVVEDTAPDYLADMNTPDLHWFIGGDQMTGFYRGSTENGYFDEDGNLEYIAEIIYTDGSLFGKTVHFEMDDLGTKVNGSKDPVNVSEGTFVFDITFQNETEAEVVSRKFDISTSIESTGCYIESLTASPLSIIMDYSVPDAGGCLTIEKLIMKDGSEIDLNYPYYKARTVPDEMSRTITSLGRVIDVNEIVSVVVHYNMSDPGVCTAVKLGAGLEVPADNPSSSGADSDDISGTDQNEDPNTDPDAAHEHKYVYDYDTYTAPSCGEDGTIFLVCECGDSYFEEIPWDDTMHDINNMDLISHRTHYDENGVSLGEDRTYLCPLCGYELTFGTE